jgi:hypothetical protein
MEICNSFLYDLSPFELYFENMAIFFSLFLSLFRCFFIMLEKSFSLVCVFLFFSLAHVSFEGKYRERDS